MEIPNNLTFDPEGRVESRQTPANTLKNRMNNSVE